MREKDQFCPACAERLIPCFSKSVLGQYQVEYFECSACGLVKTEYPHWLDDAYASAISDMDTGLVQRNIEMSMTTSRIIEANFDPNGIFLDYAGGYGLLVRLMRDKGFDFYWHDKYCTNIFARHFQKSEGESSFDLITAFEVLEHIVDPIIQIRKMAEISGNILFTTEIRPQTISEVENWWYLVPETGQHVVFYSVKSLEAIAHQLGMHFFSNHRNLHLFSRDKHVQPFSCLTNKKNNWIAILADRFRRAPINYQKKVASLTWADHLYIRDALRVSQENGSTKRSQQ